MNPNIPLNPIPLMHLTKSQFLQFLESPLHLWLAVHGFAQKPASLFDEHLKKQGYVVEQYAKDFLRQYVRTEYPKDSTISFEETLIDGNYESRIDALVQNAADGTCDLYEIKSSSSIHSRHKYDVTFQYLVGKATLPIKNVFLVHINNEYRRSGEIELDKLFVIEDMAQYIEQKKDEVYQLRLDAWKTMQQKQEPTELHCIRPKTCSFPDHCFPNLQEGSIYQLGNASDKQLITLQELGVTKLEEIPDSFSLTYKQKLQVQATRTQKPIVDTKAIQRALGQLTYPLYFLDYETYEEALPLFDGYKPHQHAVTQFSIHIVQNELGAHTLQNLTSETCEHYEFIATKPSDPSREIATELCRIIGDTGTIIVWNKNFECGRNEELAILCPDLADKLHDINARTFDLMDIFAQGFYVDARFHGSASIKQVLPVLCPHLSYKTLEIGEGTKAMLTWHEMVFGNVTAEEKAQMKQNLLTYCGLDTWAMVEIWRKVNTQYK